MNAVAEKTITTAELSEFLENTMDQLQHRFNDPPTDAREQTLEELAKLAQQCLVVASDLNNLAYSILNDVSERA